MYGIYRQPFGTNATFPPYAPNAPYGGYAGYAGYGCANGYGYGYGGMPIGMQGSYNALQNNYTRVLEELLQLKNRLYVLEQQKIKDRE